MAEINDIFDLMGAPAPSPAEIAGESSFKNVLKNKDGIDLLEEEIKAARASTEETTPAPSEMVEKSDDVPTSEPIVSATVETSVSTELYFMVDLYDKKTDKVYAVSAGWFKSEDDAKDWIDQNGEQYKTVFASKDLDLGDNPMLQNMINFSASYDSNETFSHPYIKEKIELRKRYLSFRVKSMKHFLSNLDDYFDNTKASEQSLKCTPAIETPTMVEKSDDVPTATAESSTNTVPTEDKATEPTSETVPTPELTIEEATEEAITDDAVLASNEAKTGKGKAPLKAPTYEELKASEAYMPIVNIDRLNDSQLARAAQNKLARSMNVTTFLYCWLFFAFRDDPALCKQFLIKSKDLDKAVQYITKQIGKGAKQGSVGISEGGVIELLLKYLKLDDAKIAAEEAKKEADRKAKAEARRAAKAKEKKSKKKTESKPAAPSKANTDDKAKADGKAAKKKETVKKPSTKKKSTAPKAATDDSVISLFNMF